jgi:hypothetical protein
LEGTVRGEAVQRDSGSYRRIERLDRPGLMEPHELGASLPHRATHPLLFAANHEDYGTLNVHFVEKLVGFWSQTEDLDAS